MKPMLLEKKFFDRFDANNYQQLEKISTLNRINCLAGLKSAEHGWLGACFSAMDLLTVIYYRHISNPLLPITERASVHLSKGHAAMAQYAVLAGMGSFPIEKLLTYKQSNGLPAHCDRMVEGVDSDSGSLGQGLSKAIGVSIAHQRNNMKFPVFSILGDGELQEGQLFEALLTLKSLNPGRCIPIIDRNHLQSDSQTAHIKDARNWAEVMTGIGLHVIEINGHSIEEICQGLDEAVSVDMPCIIIADTKKGYGTTLTSMSADTERRLGIWHGQIPDNQQYFQMLGELINKVNDPELDEIFCVFQAENRTNGHAEAAEEKKHKTVAPCPSTGQAFADALLQEAVADSNIYILDADLEKSCRLEKIAGKLPDQFIETGISEQDMCSIAAGLALAGKIAVTNTYASFYKRSIDQMFSCVTEKVPVIFAGHYAGADYFTDGKSHQAVNDLGLVRSLLNIEVYEPVDETSARDLLHKCIERIRQDLKADGKGRPAYFRLHRTPSEIPPEATVTGETYRFYASKTASAQKNTLFVNGPHMLQTALEASRKLSADRISLGVMAVLKFSDEEKHFKELLEKSENVFTLEDHIRETGLGAFIASCSRKNPVRIGVREFRQSTMSAREMMDNHKLDVDTVCTVIKKVLSCSHAQKIS